jgi:hypothetical protein
VALSLEPPKLYFGKMLARLIYYLLYFFIFPAHPLIKNDLNEKWEKAVLSHISALLRRAFHFSCLAHLNFAISGARSTPAGATTSPRVAAKRKNPRGRKKAAREVLLRRSLLKRRGRRRRRRQEIYQRGRERKEVNYKCGQFIWLAEQGSV